VKNAARFSLRGTFATFGELDFSRVSTCATESYGAICGVFKTCAALACRIS